jgi:hypothetical protein
MAGGMALAFAITLKLTPLLPAIFLVGQLVAQVWRPSAVPFARGRVWSLSAGIALGLLLFFFVVPSLMVGWQANLRHIDSWKRAVLLRAGDGGHDDFAGNPHTLRNQSLSNAVYRLGNWTVHEFAGGADDRRLDEHGYSPGTTVMDAAVVGWALGAVRLALVGVLLIFGARMGGRDDEAGHAAGFSLACVVTLIVSPLARTHYFMLWLPAVIAPPIWLWRHQRRWAALTVATVPAILTLSHYLAMPIMGRLGVLGLGTTIWFLATARCILATERKARLALPPMALDEQGSSRAESSPVHLTLFSGIASDELALDGDLQVQAAHSTRTRWNDAPQTNDGRKAA